LIETALKQGQAGNVLIVAAQLENMLEQILLRLMRNLSKTKADQLFEGTGQRKN